MTLHKHDHSNTAAIADADLILRTRSGDRGAFGELWRRHYPSGMSVARSITSSIDPDDLVQESYTRIYQAIIKGGGPNGSFRAYLFTSIRNTAAAWGRSRREMPIDELDTVADPDSTEQAANEALDRGLTAQAFRSLPTRWQEVLWYTEVEQMKPAKAALLLGMKAGAVSQLAFRAREGLREAWIQAHLRNSESGSECRWTIDHLGAYSRGNLSTRDQKRLDQHVDECARCLLIAAEAKDVSGRLALVLLPLVLGVTGAAGYAATLQGTAPVVAVAAMPSGVFEGGIVVADGGASAGALGVPLDGGSSSGIVGGAGGTGSGGAITGIGALVGIGSAALVVAGVVAAATIVPGLVNAPPATSLPSAGDVNNSSISSEVEPEPDANAGDKFVLEISSETPKRPEQDDQSPEVELDAGDDAREAELAPPVTPSPSEDGSGSTEPPEPSVEPEEPTVDPTEPPVDPEEPTVDPEEPTVDPEEPTDPDPGGDDDGTTDPPPLVLPEGAPSVNSAEVECVPTGGPLDKTVVTIALSGAPSATVEVNVVAITTEVFETELDVNGVGSIDLSPTALQLLGSVKVNYIAGEQEGPSSESTPFYTLINIDQCLTGRTAAEPGATTELGSTESAAAAAEEPLPAQKSLTDESVENMPAPDASAPVEAPTAEDPVAAEEPAAPEPAIIDEPATVESVTALPVSTPTKATVLAE